MNQKNHEPPADNHRNCSPHKQVKTEDGCFELEMPRAHNGSFEVSVHKPLLVNTYPLTNNEAERCLRGSVMMRKICYGTSSDRGEKFRSRILSVVETCKKRKLSPITVLSKIITAVVGKCDYPDVFELTSA